MTLWSVEVSHLRIPVGPWSSWPCPWGSSRWPPPVPAGRCVSGTVTSTPEPGIGGAMTSVTSVASVTSVTVVTSLVVVGRVGGGPTVHPTGQLRPGTGVRLHPGLLDAEPAGVLGLRHCLHVEEHEGVIEATELRALASEVAAVQRVEVEARRVARAGVAAEVELGNIEAMEDVEGLEVDLHLGPGRDHHGRVLGGLADHIDPTGVGELPAPLERIYVDDGAGTGRG